MIAAARQRRSYTDGGPTQEALARQTDMSQSRLARIEQGTVLRFEEGAVLLSEAPLRFDGRPDNRIVLEPAAGAAGWRGVVVLNAAGRSRWRHVVVRNTDAVARSGWVLTGGVTFYHSPVSMADCSFEGTRAEDALNVFGTDLSLERVTFSGCASDAFDGDFVTGTLTACTFTDGRADGVDVSGSDVEIVDCRFLDLDDKAISVGEQSRVRVRGGSIERVGLGIAAKDGSEVDVEATSIRGMAAMKRMRRALGPRRTAVRSMLSELGFDAPISYHNHHRCHAVAASPRNKNSLRVNCSRTSLCDIVVHACSRS